MSSTATSVTVGPHGRIVIPAEMRHDLGIEQGTHLSIRRQGSTLVLETRDEVLMRLKAAFATVDPSRSLSQELIDERKREAERELREP